MPKKLGVFIDSNAIGWALVDLPGYHIIDMGTHVFPVGNENFGMGQREVSKKFNKRIFRLRRVRYAHIRVRKIYLLKVLVKNKMCPLSLKELEAWQVSKQAPRDNFETWMKLDPYELRNKALREQINLYELGRILYHIACRRGYNFKERNSKLSESILKEGSPKEGKVGLNEMQEIIGNKTLGAYLYSIYPEKGVSYKRTNTRIRNRVCSTQMYFKELTEIWNVQQQFFDILTNELRDYLIGTANNLEPSGVLFFRRPLKSQKHKVGNCIYEPKKTRTFISSYEYQEVEAYKFINSIRHSESRLNLTQRTEVLRYYFTHPHFKFIEIKRLLKLEHSDGFNYDDDLEFKGSFIHSELSKTKLFGKEWFQMEDKIRQDIWHALYFFDSDYKLQEYAIHKFNFSKQSATLFSRIKISKEYAPISKKACNNILFFLRKGIPYSLAVILGGIKNALKEEWNKLSGSQITKLINAVEEIYRQSTASGFAKNLKQGLTNIGFRIIDTLKLYGVEEKEMSQKTLSYLPSITKKDAYILRDRNNILIQCVFELRKLVNKLIRVYGSVDQISCELSVDVKIGKTQRFLSQIDQKRKEKNKERYIKILREYKENITPMNLLKYQLWEECKGTCPYSGLEISLNNLWTEEIRVTYIRPWMFSLNDDDNNKALCYSFIEEELQNRTPYKYFKDTLPDEWEIIKKRTAKLFSNTKYHPSSYNKFKLFIKKSNQQNLNTLQFNDSNYASKKVQSYLLAICDKVNVLPENTTPYLIDEWLLTSLFDKKEIHTDFRFIAIKGYVNAVKTLTHIVELSKRNKYVRIQRRDKFPIPSDEYMTYLEHQINSILVSHKKETRIISQKKHIFKQGRIKVINKGWAPRGMLHKETLFGKRKSPELAEGLHIRKPLTSFKTESQINKIVDPVIRELVRAEAKKNDKKSAQNFSAIFFETASDGSLAPKLFLPNTKGGDPVPIKKVRIRESYNTGVNLKKGKNQYVIPRNNHHVLIYKDSNGKFNEDVVSFWEVIKRKRRGERVVQLINPKNEHFVTTLRINDMFLLGTENLNEDLSLESKSYLKDHLYRVQKLSSRFYEFRLAYKHSSSETKTPEYVRINNFGNRKTGWLTYNPIKVEVNVIGQIVRSKELI